MGGDGPSWLSLLMFSFSLSEDNEGVVISVSARRPERTREKELFSDAPLASARVNETCAELGAPFALSGRIGNLFLPVEDIERFVNESAEELANSIGAVTARRLKAIEKRWHQ